MARSLVEVSDALQLAPGTRLHQIYGRDRIAEKHHCSYGLSARYAARLERGALEGRVPELPKAFVAAAVQGAADL